MRLLLLGQIQNLPATVTENLISDTVIRLHPRRSQTGINKAQGLFQRALTPDKPFTRTFIITPVKGMGRLAEV